VLHATADGARRLTLTLMNREAKHNTISRQLRHLTYSSLHRHRRLCFYTTTL